jgi:Protein kinase domain
MPQGWRFIARFVGWPTRCATDTDRAGGDRLLADAASAFIDRAPIDWTALLNRARSADERAIVENLRALARARGPARRNPTQARTRRFEPLVLAVAVRIVIALAVLQTGGSLILVAMGALGGVPIGHLASQIVLALAFAAAAAMLGATASRDPRRLFLLAMFLATASAFARGALGGLPRAPVPAIEVALRGVWPEAFAPACLWQFALDFPRVRRFTWFDRLARSTAAVLWTLGLVAFVLNVGVAYLSVDERGLLSFLPNSPTNLFWRVFTLAELLAIGAILVRSRRAPAAERRRVARLSTALAASGAPFLLIGVARTLIPAVDAWLRTASAGDRIWLDYLVVSALTALPILTTAAVIVDRPFELQAVLHRTWRYAAAKSGLTAILAVPFVLLFLTIYAMRDQAIVEIVSGSRAGLLAACVCAACLVLAVRAGLFDMLDRRAFRRAAADEHHVARALDRIRLARGGREVSASLARELRESTGAASVLVLVADRRNGFADPFGTTTLAPSSALVAVLRALPDVIDLSPTGLLLPLLPPADRTWLRRQRAELAVALQASDGALRAIVMIGRRPGSGTFDRRDRWLLTTLTAAAAAVWESATIAESVASVSSAAASGQEPAFECSRCGRVGESLPLACGCASEPTLASLPRCLSGKLIIERRIGAGGMGVVYLGRDARLGREVALKTLPQLQRGTSARLRREARAMAALSHEGLATIYGLEIWRRIPVLVMEYFSDGTLADRLKHGPFARDAAIRLAIALLGPLGYMHERGVLHRDVKPSNIALTQSGMPKLMDFGLVSMFARRSGTEARTRAGAPLAGTLAYLPPEAFVGASPAPSFDLWAVAIVLSMVLPDGADCDAPLKAFLDRALARDPQVRFQTAVEMRFAFEALIR